MHNVLEEILFLETEANIFFLLNLPLSFLSACSLAGSVSKNSVINTDSPFLTVRFVKFIQQIITVEYHVDNMTILNVALTKLSTKLSSKIYIGHV